MTINCGSANSRMYAAFSFDIDGNFHSSKEGVHARSNVRMSDKKKRRKYKK